MAVVNKNRRLINFHSLPIGLLQLQPEQRLILLMPRYNKNAGQYPAQLSWLIFMVCRNLKKARSMKLRAFD